MYHIYPNYSGIKPPNYTSTNLSPHHENMPTYVFFVLEKYEKYQYFCID